MVTPLSDVGHVRLIDIKITTDIHKIPIRGEPTIDQVRGKTVTVIVDKSSARHHR